MTSAKEQYAELLALTQVYLLQEYSLQDRLLAAQDHYAYFRNYAAQKHAAVTPPPANQAAAAPSPAQISPPSPIPKPPQPPAQLKTVTAPLPQKKPIESRIIKPPAENIVQPVQQSSNLSRESASIHPSENIKPSITPKKESIFTPELPQAPQASDFNDLRKLAAEKLPGMAIIDAIPDDFEAKRNAAAWGQKVHIPQVVILSFDEAIKQQAFLVNIAKALEAYSISAWVMKADKIEQENGWEPILQSKDLRLVIASGYGTYSLPHLLKHHKEVPKQAKHFLDNIPLLLLSDLSFYLKEPTLKPSLWKVLKELLAIAPPV